MSSTVISAEAKAWGETFFASHRGCDVREMLALAFMELRSPLASVLPPVASGVGLTRRQREALVFIGMYEAQHQAAPSFDEIAQALGLASKSGVHRLVVSLEERGAIERLPNRPRSVCVRRAA